MPQPSEQNGPIRDTPWDDHDGTPPAKPASETITFDQRAQLIERLVQEAVEEPSPLAAILKASGADQLEMMLQLKPQIMDFLRSCASAEELREVQPFLDTYVKLGRLADRLLRLDQDIARADSSQTKRKRSP